MKKLINIFLFILFVISVFLALRFSTLPILNQLPNGIKEYFTLTTAELEENVFWYDFCMGVLVSYIFYILVEVLPEYIRVKKAKKILCEHINLIMEDLKMIIEIVYHIYGLEIKKDDVAIKKLISIDGNTKQEEGYYNEDIYIKKFFLYKRYSGIETSYIFPDIIYKKLKDIDTRIEKIFLVENFYSSDTNFAECIVNLKENKLIAWHKDGNTPLFTYANSSEQFYYLIKSYYRLLKMGYHNKKYSFRFLSREEISKRPEKLKNFFTDLGTRNKKFQSLNPCLIYDSRIDDNVLLSNNITINKNIHIKLVNEHEIKTYDIENNKVIIIILNHKIYRKNDYKRQLLEKNLKNKRVIILKPYIFLKNSNINSMKKYVDDVYVIPFKISYKFLKIYINRESPLRDSSRKKAYIDEIIEIANK